MPGARQTLFLVGLVLLLVALPAGAGQPFGGNRPLPRLPGAGSLPEGALRRLGPERPRLGDGVVALAVAPDGQTLVSAHQDGSLRIHDILSGTERRRFRTQPGTCRSVSFAPDGQTVLAFHPDHGAEVWDVATGERLHRFQAPTSPARQQGDRPRLLLAAFLPDGRPRVWTVQPGRGVVQWDLAGHKKERLFRLANVEPATGAVSADGRLLACSDADGGLRVWSLATTRELWHRKQHDIPPLPLLFVPNNWVLRAGRDVLLEAETGQKAQRHHQTFQGSPEQAGTFSPDSRFLVGNDLGEGAIQCWDLATARCFTFACAGHNGPITCQAFAPDGSWLATGSDDGTVFLWQAAALPWNRQPGRHSLTRRDLEQAWRRLGEADPGDSRKWDLDTTTADLRARWELVLDGNRAVALLRERLRPVHTPSHDRLALLLADLDSPDRKTRDEAQEGLRRLGGAAESTLRRTLANGASAEVHWRAEELLAEVALGRQASALRVLAQINSPEARGLLAELADTSPERQRGDGPLAGARGLCQADTWLTGQARETLRRLRALPPPVADAPGSPALLLPVQVQEVVSRPPGDHPSPPTPLPQGERGGFFSPLSPWGRGVGGEGKPLGDPLPKGATARVGTQRLRHTKDARCVLFSPDGRTVVSGGEDGTVRTWETATGKEIRCWKVEDNAERVFFLGDGLRVAATTGRGNLLVWDAVSGRDLDATFGWPARREANSILGPTPRLLLLSPDGRRLAAVNHAGLTVWEPSLRARRVSLATKEVVSCAAFTLDSRQLVLGGPGGLSLCDADTGRIVWHRDTEVLALACAGDGRTLLTFEGGRLTFRDLASGSLQCVVPGDMYLGGKLAASPDGHTAACANWYGTGVCLIDRKGTVRPLQVEDREFRIHGLAFSPDGRTLATAGEDDRVRLWDTSTAREGIDLGQVQRQAGDVDSLRLGLSPDGKTLALLIDGTLQLCDPATGRPWRRLRAGAGSLTCLAWSPDSRCLAVGVEDRFLPHRILLWEPATEKPPRQLELPGGVTFLAFAPGGRLLAAGSPDGSVHLWEPDAGAERAGSVSGGSDRRLRFRLVGHDAAVLAGAFAPDGHTLATAGADGALRLWDLTTRRQRHCWVAHSNYSVEAVAFAPAGDLLASVGGDGFVRLWRADSGALVRALPGSEGANLFVGFSADGRLLVAPGEGHTFSVWETSGRRAYRVEGHQGPVRAAAWGPDGRTLVSGSADGTALVWDLSRLPANEPEALATGSGGPSLTLPARWSASRLPHGVRAGLGEVGFAFQAEGAGIALAPDGTTVAVAVADGTDYAVSIRDWPAGTERRRLGPIASPVDKLAYAPGGCTLAVVTQRDVALWDLQTGMRRQQFPGHPDQVTCVAFSPDGKTLAVGPGPTNTGDHAAIRLWDVASGRERRLGGPPARLVQLAFAADGKRLFAFAYQGPLSVWDLTTDRLERQLPIKAKGVRFSPDGRLLCCEDDNEGMVIWDLEAGRVVSRLAGYKAESWAFSPDGRTVATTDGKLLRLWRVVTGKELWEAGGLPAATCVVGFSPDGKTLVTRTNGTPDQLRFWDAATGRERWAPAGHRGPVLALAFAADGTTLLSGGADGSVRVWQLRTGREVCQFLSQRTPGMGAVALSPDGRLAASADREGWIYLWDPVSGRDLACLTTRVDRDDPPTNLLFTPDGRLLLAPNHQGKIRVIDVRTRKELEPEDPGPGVVGGVVAPDGRRVVVWGPAGGDDQRTAVLRLRDRVKGVPVLTANGVPEMTIVQACLAPDGKTLAVSEGRVTSRWEPAEYRLRLIETATGGECLVLDPGAEVADLTFSPDGRFLAFREDGVPGHRRGIVVWDLKRARRTAFLVGPSPPTSLAFAPDGRTLAVGCHDGTVLLWEVARDGWLPPGPSAPALHVEAAWADLAGADAERARRAAWSLADNPHQILPLLRKRLRPLTSPAPDRLAALLAGLDAEDFAVRERARRALEPLVEAVGDRLRQALTRQPSAELRRQVEHLLHSEPLVGAHPERLRAFRAVMVLELIGTAEARQQLQSLAAGVVEAELTREAQAALRRLGSKGE